MITDRDICMAAHFQGGSLRDLKVKNAMSKGVCTCKPSDTIAKAEQAMRSNQIRRLPVVDSENRIVGILSLNDIAAEAEAEAGAKKHEVKFNEVGRTLTAICRHRGNGAVVAA
jgi:CBS-domain-containing membrane protein